MPPLSEPATAPLPPDDLQQRFGDLLEHLPAGVVVHGTDGIIVSANRLAACLLERSVDALVGTAVDAAEWGLVYQDGAPMPIEAYPVIQVLRSGAKVSGTIVGVPVDGHGERRWLLCNAYPECGDDGRMQGVVISFTECTGLVDTERRLQKSEERLRLILQGTSDAPWDWDLASGETYYSERWWDMFGYHPGELPADAGTWRRLMHPDDLPHCTAFLVHLLGDGRQSYSLEFRLRHRDGHDVPVLAKGFVLRDANGRALRLSGTVTDLTERKRAERRIYELAYFDHLTGLPNRRFLIEELDKTLARSSRSGQLGAVMFIDLDNFKLLNDTMGHDVGDMLLRQVAQRLRQALRDSDQLARLGGDEFVVVLENLGAGRDDATFHAGQVARKILGLLGQPYDLPGSPGASTPSIGITLFDGAGGGIDTLLKQADLAMYRAKGDGRNTARFFDQSMQAAADRQAALDSALRDGLAGRQFVLFCQPQFDRAGCLVGAEVLARWQHREHGLVGAREFIGQAETTGLIVPLGLQVLEETCRALARWSALPALGRVKLAVNVSVQQLRDPDFPRTVAALLAATGASADRLCLELTESVFAGNVQGLSLHMRQLRDQGVAFSLDDFGSGQSSLACLLRFPLAAVKIDRAFVQDGDAGGAIVEAIVALARKLGLEVVAEGVEQEAQRRFALACGCDALQGYLLGRPVPLDEFERLYGAGPNALTVAPA
ncbi:EAL domain-containing protein [Massilia forsythiae]|uniref:EAL domain-containing protein n=1 Tax=Massilia forsythiae TaxID=2728020 RepID=A0A7Z2ZTL9_9BURK|nr:GGDEF and EAL domain-containing protein [Massilia forsythiae]QJE01375.1 EAL domain-containing protein [Massilia forsythiae]